MTTSVWSTLWLILYIYIHKVQTNIKVMRGTITFRSRKEHKYGNKLLGIDPNEKLYHRLFYVCKCTICLDGCRKNFSN
jgi:hypothetical protein